MITVAILNIIVVFCAFLAQHKRTESLLKASFILIFLFLALRYDYGNDYRGYLVFFSEDNLLDTDLLDYYRGDSIDYYSKHGGFEPGWVFLCCLFKPFGFFTMTAVLALFNCFVYYRFIKKYVPPAYYWFAVFLYVFSPGFMLVHSSTMRQSVAIALFIFSIDYLYKKDAIRYFLCIGLASLFHTSALILLPVYLLGLFNWKINGLMAVSIFSLFIFLFLFGESLVSGLNLFIINYFERYEVYQEGSEIGTGLGVVFYSLLFALVLFYERLQTREHALLFKIAVLSYFFIPLSLLIMLISRVGMYSEPATLVVFPVILLNIKNPVVRNLILFLILFFTLYLFYTFFQSDTYREAFGTYKTIFSSPEIY